MRSAHCCHGPLSVSEGVRVGNLDQKMRDAGYYFHVLLTYTLLRQQGIRCSMSRASEVGVWASEQSAEAPRTVVVSRYTYCRSLQAHEIAKRG